MPLVSKEICDIMYKVIGSSFQVIKFYHRGLQESAYHAALAWELKQVNIRVRSEESFNQYYKGVKLDKTYRMDLVVNDEILVELKAKDEITSEHRLQLFNYMRLVNMKYGLLINFGEEQVSSERYYYDQPNNLIVLVDKDGNRVFSTLHHE